MKSFQFHHSSFTFHQLKNSKGSLCITIQAPDLETAIGRFHSIYPDIPISEVMYGEFLPLEKVQ